MPLGKGYQYLVLTSTRMSDDYYLILGISREASQDEIAKAYRKMARKHHPDANPDDDRAKQRFQKVQGAFDVLSDEGKRARYDRFGSQFESYPGGGGGGGSFDGLDLEQILRAGGGGFGFENLFQQFGSAQRPGPPRQGAHSQRELDISFHTAVLGGEVQLSVPAADGTVERIKVKIPAGIENGKKVRVGGKGDLSPAGGPPGDLLIKVRIAEHPFFRRRGRDLELDLPLTIGEAIQGASVDVPTPYGTITLKVPAGTSSGRRLRIKDHGIRGGAADGHLYAVAQIELPPDLEQVEDDVLESLERTYPASPRDGIRWE